MAKNEHQKCLFCEKAICYIGVSGQTGEIFCNQDCLENFFRFRITKLQQTLSDYKKSWAELRDIIGQLGYKYEIPMRMKMKSENIKEKYGIIKFNDVVEKQIHKFENRISTASNEEEHATSHLADNFYLKIWENIKTKNGVNLFTDEEREIFRAFVDGEFDT